MEILSAQTTNTSGSQATTGHPGGKSYIICEGTFNGATVSLECQAETGGEWVNCGEDATFTEAGAAILELRGGFLLRGAVASAGASTSITLRIE